MIEEATGTIKEVNSLMHYGLMMRFPWAGLQVFQDQHLLCHPCPSRIQWGRLGHLSRGKNRFGDGKTTAVGSVSTGPSFS